MRAIVEKFTLKKIILGFQMTFTVLNLLLILGVYWIQESQGLEIDVAGRNRMLSQKMTLQAVNFYHNKHESTREKCLETILMHDLSLLALKNGGEAPGMDNKYLSPSKTAARSYIIKVEKIWEKYQDRLRIILNEEHLIDSNYVIRNKEGQTSYQSKSISNPNIKSAYDWVISNSDHMLTTNNELVKILVRQDQANTNQVRYWLFLGLLANVLLVILSFIIINQYIFQPIKELEKNIGLVSEGSHYIQWVRSGTLEIKNLKKVLNRLLYKFIEATQMVKAIGKGQLDYQLNEQALESDIHSDEFFQALLNTQERIIRSDLESKQRIWANEGFARMGEILRMQNEDLKTVARHALQELIHYVDAIMGGLFILEQRQNQAYLEMIACYAYDRHKLLQKEVLPGEGLLGEVFLEKKPRIMDKIPASYIEINSGLGSKQPEYLVIYPLISNEEIIGIIELAALNNFKEHQLEFIDRISTMLASALLNQRRNDETLYLYQRAQDVTEQLKTQEEELRQNMEELRSTQEEMRRREAKYQAQIEDLSKKQVDNLGMN